MVRKCFIGRCKDAAELGQYFCESCGSKIPLDQREILFRHAEEVTLEGEARSEVVDEFKGFDGIEQRALTAWATIHEYRTSRRKIGFNRRRRDGIALMLRIWNSMPIEVKERRLAPLLRAAAAQTTAERSANGKASWASLTPTEQVVKLRRARAVRDENARKNFQKLLDAGAGKDADRDVAMRVGKSVAAVRLARLKRGIPAYSRRAS